MRKGELISSVIENWFVEQPVFEQLLYGSVSNLRELQAPPLVGQLIDSLGPVVVPHLLYLILEDNLKDLSQCGLLVMEAEYLIVIGQGVLNIIDVCFVGRLLVKKRIDIHQGIRLL